MFGHMIFSSLDLSDFLLILTTENQLYGLCDEVKKRRNLPILAKESSGAAIAKCELCRKALETARQFYAGKAQSGDQSKWIFNYMDSALSYIKERKDSLKKNQEKKPNRKLFKER